MQKQEVQSNDIVDDRRKVGDNCISFYDPDYTMKIKVYNKFVQMLESCDVMIVLGSRLHNLFVDPTDYIMFILEEIKYTGVTRIEVKIYNSEVHPENFYIDTFNQRELFKGVSSMKSILEPLRRLGCRVTLQSRLVLEL